MLVGRCVRLSRSARRPSRGCTLVNFPLSLSREASSRTTTSPTYPFPKIERPSPYQIFHLPHGATAEDVKNRYYELVRLHHPDAPHAREREPDAATRHAHFQAITTAYEKLKADFDRADGKPVSDEEAARERRRWQRPRPASFDSRTAFGERRTMDERWKDRLIAGTLGAALVVVVIQYVRMRGGSTGQILDERHKKLTSWQEQRRRQTKQDQQDP